METLITAALPRTIFFFFFWLEYKWPLALAAISGHGGNIFIMAYIILKQGFLLWNDSLPSSVPRPL